MKGDARHWNFSAGYKRLENLFFRLTGSPEGKLPLFERLVAASVTRMIRVEKGPYASVMAFPSVYNVLPVCKGSVKCLLLMRDGSVHTIKLNGVELEGDVTASIIRRLYAERGYAKEIATTSYDITSYVHENRNRSKSKKENDIYRFIPSEVSEEIQRAAAAGPENIRFPRPVRIDFHSERHEDRWYLSAGMGRYVTHGEEGSSQRYLKVEKGNILVSGSGNPPKDITDADDKIFSSGEPIALMKDYPEIAKKMWAEYIELNFMNMRQTAASEGYSFFVKSLNAGILSIMKANSEGDSGNSITSPNFYNWMNAGDDAILRIHRMQAASAFPYLMDILVSETATGNRTVHFTKPNCTDISACELLKMIDDGEPLSNRLTTYFGITPQALRSLSGIGRSAFISPYTAISLIKKASPDINPNYWPAGDLAQRREQWKYFESAMDNIFRESEGVSRFVIPTVTMYGGFSNVLKNESPFWLNSNTSVNVLDNHIADMAEDFATYVMFPAALDVKTESGREISYESVKKLLSKKDGNGNSPVSAMIGKKRSYVKMAEISNRWYKEYNKIQAEIVKETDKRSWPALFSPLKLGVFSAVPLISAVELAEEGEAMDHCVDNYVTRCITGETHIISLRYPDGSRASTVELGIETEGETTTVYIRQNQTYENAEPDENIRKAAEDLVCSLNTQPELLNLKEMKDYKGEHDADGTWQGIEGIRNILRYDPFDTHARNVALRAYSFILPREMRNLTYAEWTERSGLREILETLEPKAQVSDRKPPAYG